MKDKSMEGQETSLDRIIRIARSAPERIRDALLMKTARLHPAPVFALGNQKAGTTAVAALLGAATGKSVTHDFIYLLEEREQEGLMFGREPLSEFVARRRLYFSRDIIKDNSLTFFHRELKELFPAAGFFTIVRDPRDNIRSILNRLGLPGDAGELSDEHRKMLREHPLTWRLMVDGEWPPVEGSSCIERMARRWVLAAQVYTDSAGEMELFRYEDFVADKAGRIAALAEKMGMQAVNDVSELVDVQYQPRGDRRATWAEFFGEKNLGLIEDVCGEVMEKFGYERSV